MHWIEVLNRSSGLGRLDDVIVIIDLYVGVFEPLVKAQGVDDILLIGLLPSETTLLCLFLITVVLSLNFLGEEFFNTLIYLILEIICHGALAIACTEGLGGRLRLVPLTHRCSHRAHGLGVGGASSRFGIHAVRRVEDILLIPALIICQTTSFDIHRLQHFIRSNAVLH